MVYFPPPSPENEWESDFEEEDGIADQEPLSITWIPVHTYSIALCSLPGSHLGVAKRSLVADLESLKNAGIEDTIVLCTDSELRKAKVQTLLVDYAEKGFVAHHHPIDDDQLPEIQQCMEVLQDLHSCLQRGGKTAIHCSDGYGRSCLILVLLAMLLDENLPAPAAIEHIQHTRGPAAIQTIKQYNFIMEFHKNLSEFRSKQS